jgi:hypothetical protein
MGRRQIRLLHLHLQLLLLLLLLLLQRMRWMEVPIVGSGRIGGYLRMHA